MWISTIFVLAINLDLSKLLKIYYYNLKRRNSNTGIFVKLLYRINFDNSGIGIKFDIVKSHFDNSNFVTLILTMLFGSN